MLAYSRPMSEFSAQSPRRRRALEILGIDAYRARTLQATVNDPGEVTAALTEAVPQGAAAAPGDAIAPQSIEAMDWEALQREVSGCTRCGLCQGRTQTVFGVGSQTANFMVIGEAPGAEEDRQGEPFVGRAGRLLDQMLLAIGRSRADSAYITNIVKCRPPRNRDPEAEEAAACRPYLRRQIELLKPAMILAVGRVAAQNLLETDAPLVRLRGRVHRTAEGMPVLVTYHPAYLLRSPGEKRKVWEDLKQAWDMLENAS